MKLLEKYSKIDMLNGSIWDKLIVFAIPLAFTGMLQFLFNSADIFILGHFLGDKAMAAVGNTVPIVGLIVNLFLGISLGANVVVARYLGQKDGQKANEAVHTSFGIAIILGLAVTIIALVLSKQIVLMLDVPNEIFEDSLTYLRCFLFGLPFLIIYNFEAALYRAKGNTKDALVALLIAGIFNIFADLIAVKVLNSGESGVALATVLSYFICAFYLFIRLTREKDELRVELKKIRLPNLRQTKAIINIGLPAGIQGMVFSASNLVVQSAINSLGADAMAASAIDFIIETNLYSFVNAFGLAATTFISQNYGAKNLERCRHIMKVSLLISILVTAVITLPVILVADKIIMLLTQSSSVLALAMIRFYFISAIQPVNCIMEILSGAMRGYGYSLPPALVTLFCVCGQRLIWIFTVFKYHQDFTVLMATYPISWGLTTVGLILLYIYHQRKLKA